MNKRECTTPLSVCTDQCDFRDLGDICTPQEHAGVPLLQVHSARNCTCMGAWQHPIYQSSPIVASPSSVMGPCPDLEEIEECDLYEVQDESCYLEESSESDIFLEESFDRLNLSPEIKIALRQETCFSHPRHLSLNSFYTHDAIVDDVVCYHDKKPDDRPLDSSDSRLDSVSVFKGGRLRSLKRKISEDAENHVTRRPQKRRKRQRDTDEFPAPLGVNQGHHHMTGPMTRSMVKCLKIFLADSDDDERDDDEDVMHSFKSSDLYRC